MAGMRAKVELRDSLSHTGGGRIFKKGSPQIITSAAEIAYYRSQGGFAVTMLEAPKEKASTAPMLPPPVPLSKDGDDEGYTENQLIALNKSQLTEVAEEFGLELGEDLKKVDMIAAVLATQKG